jgi:hypothetical protein
MPVIAQGFHSKAMLWLDAFAREIAYIPPVLWTFKTLSFPPSCWNALTSGAATVKTAH